MAGSTSGERTNHDRFEGIPGLMGLRAVMGTWVVADHLFEPMRALFPGLAVLQPLLSGGIALETFFILSGFVICHVYAQRLAPFDPRAYGAFLWARVARLWPTHVFALGVTTVIVAVLALRGSAPVGSGYSVGTFVGNVVMLQGVPGVVPWNIPSWSVSTEMAAYLLVPVVAVIVVRARRGAAFALTVLVVAAELAVLPRLAAMSPTVVYTNLFWVRPLADFALGCALWAAWRQGIRRHRGWDVVALGALGGVAAIMYAAPSTSPAMYDQPSGQSRILAVALLGVMVVAVTGATGPVGRLLDVRPMRWAGRTSYSRYLLHLPVLTALEVCVPLDRVVTASPVVRAALVTVWFAAVFVAGGLTHRFVEEPARRRLRRLGRVGPAGSADPVACDARSRA